MMVDEQGLSRRMPLDIWKSIALLSVAANVTGVGTWLSFGTYAVTKQELDAALSRAPYPWLQDRSLVLGHLSDSSVHENDLQKRERIRGELSSSLSPIEKEIGYIRDDLRDIRSEIKALQRQPRPAEVPPPM